MKTIFEPKEEKLEFFADEDLNRDKLEAAFTQKKKKKSIKDINN